LVAVAMAAITVELRIAGFTRLQDKTIPVVVVEQIQELGLMVFLVPMAVQEP
jgi:hypothetical protein